MCQEARKAAGTKSKKPDTQRKHPCAVLLAEAEKLQAPVKSESAGESQRGRWQRIYRLTKTHDRQRVAPLPASSFYFGPSLSPNPDVSSPLSSKTHLPVFLGITLTDTFGREPHQFSTLPGVQETAQNTCLNDHKTWKSTDSCLLEIQCPNILHIGLTYCML